MEQIPNLQHISQERERKKRLFLMQKSTLDTFLKNGALTREQYLFSCEGLVTKMNISKEELSEWSVSDTTLMENT